MKKKGQKRDTGKTFYAIRVTGSERDMNHLLTPSIP